MGLCSSKTLSIKIVCAPNLALCLSLLAFFFLRWRYSVFIGQILKVQLFCHGRNAMKFYGSHLHPLLAPSPQSHSEGSYTAVRFSFLKPRAAPFLSALKPSELTNTHTPQLHPIALIHLSGLSFLFHTCSPLSCTEHLLWASHCSLGIWNLLTHYLSFNLA